MKSIKSVLALGKRLCYDEKRKELRRASGGKGGS